MREYWIADPVHKRLEVWTHDDGAFMRFGVFSEGDTSESKVLGVEMTLENIFGVAR